LDIVLADLSLPGGRWLRSIKPLEDVLSNEPGNAPAASISLDSNLHSPERRLIELRMEHADLDAMIDRAADQVPMDELMLRRLKKRRLVLRDEISRLELALDPKEPA
jgi:hypothetical protein